MLASNYQMPANGWNGLIELSLGGVRKVRGNTKVLGAVGLNPDENHSKPVLTSVLRFLQGMCPEFCGMGDKNSCYWIITETTLVPSRLLEFSKFLN